MAKDHGARGKYRYVGKRITIEHLSHLSIWDVMDEIACCSETERTKLNRNKSLNILMDGHVAIRVAVEASEEPFKEEPVSRFVRWLKCVCGTQYDASKACPSCLTAMQKG